MNLLSDFTDGISNSLIPFTRISLWYNWRCLISVNHDSFLSRLKNPDTLPIWFAWRWLLPNVREKAYWSMEGRLGRAGGGAFGVSSQSVPTWVESTFLMEELTDGPSALQQWFSIALTLTVFTFFFHFSTLANQFFVYQAFGHRSLCQERQHLAVGAKLQQFRNIGTLH